MAGHSGATLKKTLQQVPEVAGNGNVDALHGFDGFRVIRLDPGWLCLDVEKK